MTTKTNQQVCRLCGMSPEGAPSECSQAFKAGKHIWMARDERTAEAAFIAKHEVAERLAFDIDTILTQHDDQDAERIDWGSVGDMDEIVRRLRDLRDLLYHEGDYAPTAR